MFERIETDRKPGTGTVSGVVKKGDLVLTVQIPTVPATGKLVEGGIRAQARQVFANLKQAMESAGGSLADVMLVQVYIVDSNDWAAMHEVWGETFSAPFPSRATVVVKELMLEGMLIEIVVTAHLG